MVDVKINLIVIIFLCLLLITYFFYLLKNKKLYISIFFRTILFLILIILMLKVSYKVLTINKKFDVIFLIDNSYSMTFNQRLSKVNTFLEKNFKQIEKKANVKYFVFNDDAQKIEKNVKIEVTKKNTNIKKSIENILFQNKNVDVIILFTDGNDIYEKYPDFTGYKTVVYPINFNENNFKDVAIKDLRYSTLGFKGTNYELTCVILNYGYDNKNILVTIADEKEVLDTKRINLKSGKNEVKLNFVPKDVGKKRYYVKIEHLLGEVSYENNKKYFELEVIKDKIRILYICGEPSTEYYFLRSMLKNEPNFDLVSFVILRNNDSQIIVPDEDLSLIPFPIHDIFVKELNNYDLLLLENFSYKKFSIPVQYLENIKRYVSTGGGFIMIGGKNSFSLGGYKNTPIEDILPVEIYENEEFVKQDFVPKVNDYFDPLLKIYDNLKHNESILKNIPSLKNYNKVGYKQGSKVIFWHPVDKLGQNYVPISSYWKFDKGRVFTISSGNTWKWVLENMLSKNYDFKNMYVQFWKNVIYWCGGITEIKNIRILFDKENIVVDDNIKIRIVMSGKHTIEPELYVTYPDLTKVRLNIKKISLQEYVCEMNFMSKGRYAFTAFYNENNVVYRDDKIVYVRENIFDEIVNLKINEDYLNKIANITGGMVINYDNFELEEIIDHTRKNKGKEYSLNYEIYNNFLVGIVFMLIFISEIFFMRKFR